MKYSIRGLAPLCVLLAVAPLRGALLFDQSPEATGGTILPNEYWVYENVHDGQNLAERIIFDYTVRLTGMDVYTYGHFGRTGREVLVRTWSEVNAGPATESMTSFVTNLTEVDTDGIGLYGPPSGLLRGVRAHAEFGAGEFVLPANTPLWIGMMGWESLIAPRDLGLFGLGGLGLPGDGGMWRFRGTGDDYFDGQIGDMAMRIYGERVETPPPPPPPPPTGIPDGGTTVLLLGLSLTLLSAVRCVRRA